MNVKKVRVRTMEWMDSYRWIWNNGLILGWGGWSGHGVINRLRGGGGRGYYCTVWEGKGGNIYYR